MFRRGAFVVFLAVCVLLPGREVAAAVADPLERAHAHNAYEHSGAPVPDALTRRFGSIEADVWLHDDGSLQVHHFPLDPPVLGTLRSLYLEPLRRRIKANGGRVYTDRSRPLQLLIDIKTCPPPAPAQQPPACPHAFDASRVWAAIERELADYRGDVSRYLLGAVAPGAVEVVITGDVPLDAIRAAGYRRSFAHIDRLGSNLPPAVASLVNLRYDVGTASGCRYLTRAEVRALTDDAHREGRRMRFWWNKPCGQDPTPDQLRRIWHDLWDAGVDHISGDDMDELSAFLRNRADTATDPSAHAKAARHGPR